MIQKLTLCTTDPSNLKGSEGDLTSATFNYGSLDYLNISVSWNSDGAIPEHTCRAWLDSVTDGCDVPSDDGAANSDNLKHGGSVEYQNINANATLTIQPLAIRRLWNGGQVAYDCKVTNWYKGQYAIERQDTRLRELAGYCDYSVSHAKDDSDSGIAEAGDDFSMKMAAPPLNGALEFKTQWPTNRGQRTFQIFRDECIYFLTKLV